MSFIVGIVHTGSHPVDPAHLNKMTSTAAKPGIGSWDTWCEGPIGLAQFSKPTIPGSKTEQALVHDLQSGVRLAADMRIDNAAELRQALGGEAASSPSPEMGHLLLQAYLKWGPGFVDRLAGDFAFALWDPRQRRLLCARDPMGVRQFYYCHIGDVFVLASAVAPIIDLHWVPKQLNEVRIADYLVQNFEDKQITFYKHILRLPPGHLLTVSPDGPALQEYWHLDPDVEVTLGSDREYAEAFYELFAEAIRSRLGDDLPTGSMLSGGLDSSSITCVARNHLAEMQRLPLHTFSAVFPAVKHLDARIDESRFMQAIIATGGLEPHFVPADEAQPLAEWMWGGDEPVPAPNIYMDLALFKAAREAGMQVMLSGFDGDSTVSYGFEHMATFLLQGKWPQFVRETISLASRFEVDRKLIFWRLGVKPLIPGPAMRLADRLRGRPGQIEAQPGAIDFSFARRLNLEERVERLSLQGSSLQLSPREQHRRSITSGLLDYALSQLHIAGAIAEIEPRYPFFDRRLIEFSLALPSNQKLNRGWTRYVVRNAMEGVLPDEVRWRSGKSNLSVNFKQRLKESFRGMDPVAFVKAHANLAGYVDQDQLLHAFQRFQSRPVASEKDALTIFLTVVLSRWLTESALTN